MSAIAVTRPPIPVPAIIIFKGFGLDLLMAEGMVDGGINRNLATVLLKRGGNRRHVHGE